MTKTVDFIHSDSFSLLEIVAYTELMKKNQEHTSKIFFALFQVNDDSLLLSNRLQDGDKFKEEREIVKAKENQIPIFRRITYGTNWRVQKGVYISFVYPSKDDFKQEILQFFSNILEGCVTFSQWKVRKDEEEIGYVGTYTESVNTIVELYLPLDDLFEEIASNLVDFLEEEEYSVNESLSLNVYNKNLLTSLINGKYSTESWIFESRTPFIEGKCLIELLVAYPPTRYCKEFILKTKQAIDKMKIKDKVKLVIYERGKKEQLLQNIISNGILTAFKSHRIPALVVNGNIKATRAVPTVEEIMGYISEEMSKLNIS